MALVAGARRWMCGVNTRTAAVRACSTVVGGAGSSDGGITNNIQVNGRSYALPKPNTATVVMCIDGCAQEYLDICADVMPATQSAFFSSTATGVAGLAQGAVPTYTNPNNMAIVSGAPPRVTGIAGNYYINEDGEEVMANDADCLWCDTILSAASHAGARVITVTAKNKLLALLSKGLAPDSIAFSSEFAASEATTNHIAACGLGLSSVPALMDGREPPPIYSGDVSIYALEAGARLVQLELEAQRKQGAHRPVLAYLSTSDYIQHKHVPDSDGARHFYAALDGVVDSLLAAGCTVGLTADHGMNDKHVGGVPVVLFAESVLSEANVDSKVILPITDPYVVHHGALGGYGNIHVSDPADIPRAREVLLAHSDVVEEVLTRDEACSRFDLPSSRVGDLVVLCTKHGVLGRTPEFHDLSEVHNLRSHGSLHERQVPLLVALQSGQAPLDDTRLQAMKDATANSWDVFDYVLN